MPLQIWGTLRDTRNIASVEWQIENYLESEKEKECLSSPSFQLSDATWYLMIRPNGATWNNTVGSISLHLMKEDSETEKHLIHFTLGIKKSNGGVYKSSEDECEFVKDGHGCQIMERSQLLEMKDVLLTDNSLQIFCLARLVINPMAETASQTPSLEGTHTLIENLTEFFLKKKVSDVTIKVKDREFQAYRSLLSSRSPVFASMLDQDTNGEKSDVMDIADCDPNVFDAFLLYLHTGKIDKVSRDNVFDLYKIANKFDVGDLKTICAGYMAHNMSLDLFFDCVIIAMEHKEAGLLYCVHEFFFKNGAAILSSPRWTSLVKDNDAFANELLIEFDNFFKTDFQRYKL